MREELRVRADPLIFDRFTVAIAPTRAVFEQMRDNANAIARAFAVPMHLANPYLEYPVDRARRQRVATAMRRRARRAARHGRVLR